MLTDGKKGCVSGISPPAQGATQDHRNPINAVEESPNSEMSEKPLLDLWKNLIDHKFIVIKVTGYSIK